MLEDPQNPSDPERPYFKARLYEQSNPEIECATYAVVVQQNLAGFNRLCVNEPQRSRGGGGGGGNNNPLSYTGTNQGCPQGAVGYDGSSTSVSSGNNPPNTQGTCGNNQLDIYWKDWTTVAIPLNNYFGQNVTIVFEAADCEPSGHLGYAYLDGECLSQKVQTKAVSVCPGRNERSNISAPQGFALYNWTGPASGIKGSATVPAITVARQGIYTVVLTPINQNTGTGSPNNSCQLALKYNVVENCVLPVNIHSFEAHKISDARVKLNCWSLHNRIMTGLRFSEVRMEWIGK